MTDLSQARWQKSSYSGTNNCVEVAYLDGQVAVRHSSDRRGPVLLFTRSEWRAFVEGVRGDEFDFHD
jgi:hypothetical protein